MCRHVGPFSADAIASFVVSVLSGQQKLGPFSMLPVLSSATDCASIHALFALPDDAVDDDDFDLSELMSELEEDREREKQEEVEADVTAQQEMVRVASARAALFSRASLPLSRFRAHAAGCQGSARPCGY